MPARKASCPSQGWVNQRLPRASTRPATRVSRAAARARAKLRSPSAARSAPSTAWSWSWLSSIHPRGRPRLRAGGTRVTSWARRARQPARVQGIPASLSLPANQRRLRRRSWRSQATSRLTNARVIRASPTAPWGSPSLCQRCRIVPDRVGTPSSSTAPSSFTTSMPARATPAPMAGAAIGRATRRKLPHGPTPRLRQASSWRWPPALKLSVARRNT